MLGKNIFYPVGWDDNGLPTERRVQNVFGVKCDSTLPYDKEFKPDISSQIKIKVVFLTLLSISFSKKGIL